MKRVYDTSSLVDIWRYYLRRTGLFPEFWAWLLASFQEEAYIPADAFEELEREEPDFAELLKAQNVKPVEPNERIDGEDRAIREELGVGPKGFSSAGVDEADVAIIATAKVLQATLISEEKQKDPPKRLARYKIPSVCKLPSVKVQCMDIKDMLSAIKAGR